MFFGFQLTCGLMLVFYGYSVMKNPRVWGDQGQMCIRDRSRTLADAALVDQEKLSR